MIDKINFTGKVFVAPSAKPIANKKEAKKIQNYADKYNVDVFVYSHDSHSDGFGMYSAIVAKEGQVWQKTFDMEYAGLSRLREIPVPGSSKTDQDDCFKRHFQLKTVDESVFDSSEHG